MSGVHLAQLRQHRAQQLGRARMPRRHRRGGSGVQRLDLAELQAVGLAAAAHDAKALLAHAGQAQQAVLQLMEVDDLRHGADVVVFRRADFAALADQHHAEAAALAHAAAHHVDIARFENAQRQRAAREQHDVERKQRRAGRSGQAAPRAGAAPPAACRAVRRSRHCSSPARDRRRAAAAPAPRPVRPRCREAARARRAGRPPPRRSQPRSGGRIEPDLVAPRQRGGRAARGARRASWCWSAARAPRRCARAPTRARSAVERRRDGGRMVREIIVDRDAADAAAQLHAPRDPAESAQRLDAALRAATPACACGGDGRQRVHRRCARRCSGHRTSPQPCAAVQHLEARAVRRLRRARAPLRSGRRARQRERLARRPAAQPPASRRDWHRRRCR